MSLLSVENLLQCRIVSFLRTLTIRILCLIWNMLDLHQCRFMTTTNIPAARWNRDRNRSMLLLKEKPCVIRTALPLTESGLDSSVWH